MLTKKAGEAYVGPERVDQARTISRRVVVERMGAIFAAQSGTARGAPSLGKTGGTSLEDAPGAYVLQR